MLIAPLSETGHSLLANSYFISHVINSVGKFRRGIVHSFNIGSLCRHFVTT